MEREQIFFLKKKNNQQDLLLLKSRKIRFERQHARRVFDVLKQRKNHHNLYKSLNYVHRLIFSE